MRNATPNRRLAFFILAVVTLSSVVPAYGKRCGFEAECETQECCRSCCSEEAQPSCCDQALTSTCCCQIDTPPLAVPQAETSKDREYVRNLGISFSLELSVARYNDNGLRANESTSHRTASVRQAMLCCWQT